MTGFINSILEVLNNNLPPGVVAKDNFSLTNNAGGWGTDDDIIHDPTIIIRDILELKRHM